MTRVRLVALGAALSAAGCSSYDFFNRDRDALNKFSRAYTEFRNIGADTEAVRDVYLGPEIDSFGFWAASNEAFATDPGSNDAGRLEMARSAIVSYDQSMPRSLEKFSDQVGKLDKAVGQLFETANAIHNRKYREDAVQIAKYAREAQASVALVQTLEDQRLRYQRQALSDVVNADGSLARAFRASAMEMELNEINKISEEIQDAAKRSTAAMQNLKDTFSALKGKTNLKAYPTKDELQDEKTGR